MHSKIITLLALAAPLFAAALPSGSAYPEDIVATVFAQGIPEEVASELRVIAEPGLALEKRADHGVYLGVNANWAGYAVKITSPTGVCVPLASDLNDKVSAVGPDAGTFCDFFVGASFRVGNPGYFDLSQNGGFWNDKLSSYRCFSG